MNETICDKDFPALPGKQPKGEISLSWWQKAHEEQLRLCSELEAIADSLPSNINRQKCIYAAKALGPLIKGLHHYEEHVLFPAIETRSQVADLEKTLARLRFEHVEDECFAEELAERLLLIGAGDANVNMEATGYMLRGFFEAMRRHIAFEREHLVSKLSAAV